MKQVLLTNLFSDEANTLSLLCYYAKLNYKLYFVSLYTSGLMSVHVHGLMRL